MDENTKSIIASNLTVAAFQAGGKEIVEAYHGHRPAVGDANCFIPPVLKIYRLLLAELSDESVE